MKILFIAPSNSVHTLRWVERATNSGINSGLLDLVPNSSKPESLKVSRYYSYSATNNRILRVPILGELIQLVQQTVDVKKAISDFSPDLIHCHWLFHSIPFLATFQKKIPIISTPWGSDLQMPIKPLRGRIKKTLVNRFLTKRIIRRSSALCCDSEKLASLMLSRGANVTPQIIYFGTDTLKFSSKSRSIATRSKFGGTEHNLLVISNRSHEEVYDIPTLIYAGALLNQTHPHLRFIIAGSGSLTDSLKQLVSELHLNDSFFFTGRLTDDEFLSATASCDIYVSTSTSDGGLAASTAEAMACEIPVVISNFGENANWLCNEQAGFLFKIGDPQELSEKIKLLADSETLRREMGSKGRKKILADNNIELEWNKVVSLYRNTIRKV